MTCGTRIAWGVFMGINVAKLRAEYEKPHYLIPTSDGQILFLSAWEPSKPSKTALLIFHGITANSAVYSMLGIPVADAGFSAFGLDLRGHGLSDGKRGDYPSKARLVADVCETINFVKQQGFEGVVLLGHSLGNLVALEALNACDEHVAGLILLSVGRTVNPGAYPKMSMGQKLKTVGKLLFAYNRPVIEYKREGMIGLDDPLFTFKYTPRFLRILDAQKFAKQYQFPDHLGFPVFAGVGEHDEIFSVETTRAFFDEVPSETKEFQVIPGAKHAEYPKGCWNGLIAWLKQHFT